MGKWLAIAVVLPLISATAATAQMKGLRTRDVASVATTRTLDLRLSEELGVTRPVPFMRGLVLSHDVAPNATMGVGFTNMYGRKRGGAEFRFGDQPGRSSKPGITFVLKF
jgi:hypothetical protein